MSRIGNRQRIAYSVQRTGKRKIPVALRYALSAQEGLTLVEVLLAVVILSVGVAGVLRAYAGSVQTLEIGQENIEAINFLKEKMSNIQQQIIEEKGLSAGSSTGDFEGSLKDYAWESVVQSGPQEGLHELYLTVYRPGQTRQFSLTTYVENKDYAEK